MDIVEPIVASETNNLLHLLWVSDIYYGYCGDHGDLRNPIISAIYYGFWLPLVQNGLTMARKTNNLLHLLLVSGIYCGCCGAHCGLR